MSTDVRKRLLPQNQDTSWERPPKDHRRARDQQEPRRPTSDRSVDDGSHDRKEHENFAREQTRLNQIQEAEKMREWVSKEDDFVLQQSKKKARIRVREGRAKTIDWLAVTLSAIDPTRDLLEEDEMEPTVDVIDPSAIFEGLSHLQLQDLEKDIETYRALESNHKNRKYWAALRIICRHYQDKIAPSAAASSRQVTRSVSADVERLLGPKSLLELTGLEMQISKKLRSNEPIDVEYWEQLLSSVGVYKARAELSDTYQTIIKSRLDNLRDEERAQATEMSIKLRVLLENTNRADGSINDFTIQGLPQGDPEPMLKLQTEEKALENLQERDFLAKIALERRRVLALKFVPLRQAGQKGGVPAATSAAGVNAAEITQLASLPSEDFSAATTALYEREVARGVQEDEEIFAGEEVVSTKSKAQWAGKYRPRKPRYFNRVQMGYEWNKYNQTHYDHDNPPPKVVQGYKFNIFYPELIDKTKAPTYRIERENGRKRGETFAPAGEEDTCLIRFISGPPYEDLGFKIVDKEWDFSAKRERGFRSSFDKGILQLHFQFKKVFYRK